MDVPVLQIGLSWMCGGNPEENVHAITVAPDVLEDEYKKALQLARAIPACS